METEKRLFFGMEVQAPWPETLPSGRILDENHRHMTLAFLGKTNLGKMQEALLSFPQPTFKVGFAAKFDQCLFLPLHYPRVVAWHVEWLERSEEIDTFYQTLTSWLLEKGFSPDMRHPLMPHVTLARSPFDKGVWQKEFSPLPAFVHTIHLYESLGHLNYVPIWSYPLFAPFEEFAHTADIAYKICGKTFDQLFLHASLALSFNFPPLLPFFQKKEGFEHLEDVIIALNHLVAQADQEIGCPFKAVSFHSDLENRDSILQWEMIVDV